MFINHTTEEYIKLLTIESAKYNLCKAVIPVMCQVINRHKNKRLGEKTRQRIADEIARLIDCRLYFHQNYKGEYNEICFYPLDEDGRCTLQEAATLFVNVTTDGKINQLSPEDFKISKSRYREDIPAIAQQLTDLYDQIKAQNLIVLDLLAQFNELRPEGVDYLSMRYI